MGLERMGSKRRHYDSSERGPKHSHRDDSYSSIGDTKRRRLSSEADELGKANFPSHDQRDAGSPNSSSWTIVTTKVNKKRDNAARDHDYRQNDYPALRMHQNYQSDLKIKDLRDLALYVLADEVAPKWTAVANSRNVKKVVVLMVPGLDEELLRRAQRLIEKTKQQAARDESSYKREVPNAPVDNNQGSAERSEPDVTKLLTSEARFDDFDAPYDWLFKHLLRVKAPGDAKMNKIHSPLQAMLLSQASDNKQGPGGMAIAGHSSDRAAITEFILSADELREAEYPIHPATFTSEADAKFEAKRRDKTGQAAKHGWVDTNVDHWEPRASAQDQDWMTQGLRILSLDCEMVQTSNDAFALARISLIEYPDGKVWIDKYVKPDLPITNYNTQYSGITPEILENVTTKLQDIQQELLEILTPSTVLLGHSLDSDLNALRMTHPFVVDTSIIFPHPRGLPLRSSLKYLANKYLKREIQTGGATGHNSVEDAKAVLDLVKLKCEKGVKYGTMEANGEPIFRRLKRNGRTSAMVEYGTPERGYGKDATYTIGCQNDEEVVKGIVRAVKGDDYYEFEIPAGGVDFVWGRLRALEFAREWVSGSSTQHRQVEKEAVGHAEEKEKSTASDEEKLDALAVETLQHMQAIFDALPERSLFIIFSGTGDMRPVMRLQAQQQQYRKEFKVKKWDELSVKWTDTEEQALKKACENARAGWGVCAVK